METSPLIVKVLVPESMIGVSEDEGMEPRLQFAAVFQSVLSDPSQAFLAFAPLATTI